MKLLKKNIIDFSRLFKKLIMVVNDLIIVLASISFAFFLRYEEFYIPRLEDNSLNYQLIYLVLISPIIAVMCFYFSKIYDLTVRYINLNSIIYFLKSVTIFIIILVFITIIFDIKNVPRSVYAIQWMTLIILLFSSRILAQFLINNLSPDIRKNLKKILIYGGSNSAFELSNLFRYSDKFQLLGLIDDNQSKIGQVIGNINVYSSKEIDRINKNETIDEILIPTSQISKKSLNEIILNLSKLSISVKKIPSISDLIQGKLKTDDIKSIEIDDLLSRGSVSPDENLLKKNIYNKNILVTGAGGSIGSELCRKIIKLKPDTLVLYDHDEFSLFDISLKIEAEIGSKKEIKLISILGDVVNGNKIKKVINENKIQTIYHAAAYKHVTISENNPLEFINNNIFGTYMCAYQAQQSKVETFVLISTDKAVRPLSIMGKTKRVAELIIQSLSNDKNNKTSFSIVRFGNVLGSSGSVIPLFKNQINDGGPITITDENVIRYFMTISEASELVIQAGAMGKNAEVFVLDMGKPVKIIDLAKKMINLSGLSIKNEKNPKGDIEIKVIGLRKGEKLVEELLIENNVENTGHKMILKANEEMIPLEQILEYLDQLKTYLDNNDEEQSINILKKIAPSN